MSTHKHATISAWQREENGGYKAEINGWLLRVHWHPESIDGKTKQRGFSWDAKQGDLPRFVSRDVHEEIELAMVAAEDYPAHAEAAAAADRKAEAEAAETDAGH
jgi:hypothetical protein